MLTIAVTGKIASGKTTVCLQFSAIGYKYISCDDIVKEGQKKGHFLWQNLKGLLSEEFFNEDQSLDKNKISDKLLEEPAFKKQIEKIVHPYVKTELTKQLKELESKETKACVVEIPLLFEAAWEDMFDKIVITCAAPEIRISRLESRKGISYDKAKKWIDLQKSDYDKLQSEYLILETDEDNLNFKGLIEKLKIV